MAAKKMQRREFVIRGSAAAVGAGLALTSGRVFGKVPAQSGSSRVVEVVRPGTVAEGRVVDQAGVKTMLREGLRKLTGSERPWAEFVKPTDRIGLKINTLGRPLLFTHHELIRAVADDLKEFGVPEKNIIVWDRFETHMRDCRFEFNTGGPGCFVYGTDGLDPAVRRYDAGVTYVSENDDPGQRGENGTVSRFSSIFTKECDKVINLAILKDHRMCGVTLTLKNLAYGLCDNNGRFHGPKHIQAFIADFCAHPLVREKVVLHLVDALEACYDGGPAPRNPRTIYTADTLYFGLDPVALDAVGRRAIDARRVREGLPEFLDAGRPYDHIRLAAEKGLGIDDLDRIRVDRLDLA